MVAIFSGRRLVFTAPLWLTRVCRPRSSVLTFLQSIRELDHLSTRFRRVTLSLTFWCLSDTDKIILFTLRKWVTINTTQWVNAILTLRSRSCWSIAYWYLAASSPNTLASLSPRKSQANIGNRKVNRKSDCKTNLLLTHRHCLCSGFTVILHTQQWNPPDKKSQLPEGEPCLKGGTRTRPC